MGTITYGSLLDSVVSRVGREKFEAHPEAFQVKEWAIDCLRWLLPIAPVEAVSENAVSSTTSVPPVTKPADSLRVISVKHQTGHLARYVEPDEYRSLLAKLSSEVLDPGSDAAGRQGIDDFYVSQSNGSIVRNESSIFVCRKSHTTTATTEPGDYSTSPGWGKYWWGPFSNDTAYTSSWVGEDQYLGDWADMMGVAMIGTGSMQGIGSPASRIWTEIEGAIHVYRMLCSTDGVILRYLEVPSWSYGEWVSHGEDTVTYYYQCIQSHEASTDNEPSGATAENWELFWTGRTQTAPTTSTVWSASNSYDSNGMTIPNGWEGLLSDYCSLQAEISLGGAEAVERRRQRLNDELVRLSIREKPSSPSGGS